ncbi:sigma-70 family RNA polymerase sigma factor [Clostridium sp.]|uniref:RNA polymerase sigma factor n=1 Tax=Clostridium sp. TaxID=1506 RepID=UPI002FCA8F58
MVNNELINSFNKLYDETYLNVLRLVTLKCSNTADVSDIVQEVFTEAYKVMIKKGPNYIDNPQGFILRLTKTKIYKHYTLIEKLKKIIPILSSNETHEEINIVDLQVDLNQQNIEEALINKHTIDEIWRFISLNPQDVQKIFFLYYYCDMSLKEIAKELKISESNVKHKLYRSLEKIRSIYKEGGENL